MDHVEAEDQRDFQPRLLDCYLLQAVCVLAGDIEERANLTAGNHRVVTAAACSGRILAELAELLLLRHLLQQRLDAGFGSWIVGPYLRPSGCNECQAGNHSEKNS